MKIEGGLVFDENYSFTKKDIFTDGEFFSEKSSDDEVMDASGCYVIPGLVDIHVHGCMGSDFCDATAESIEDFLKFEASCGVTAICPTTMTVPKEKLLRVADATKEYMDTRKAAAKDAGHFIGINMEGPFISPEKKGSQELSDICDPDADFVRQMNDRSGGMIKLVDIAPERPGAFDFIKELKDEFIISVAHTDCDYDTALEAMKLGAHHVTHLYNAMRPYLHRAPGPVGAAIDDKACMSELITDGVHHHSSVDRNTFTLLGADRVVLISDSMRATGLPDGTYELGGHEVFVKGKKALLSDGTIAASVTNLFDCMMTAADEIGIPFEIAVRCATINPAKSVKADDMIGSIETGKYADFLLIDKDSHTLKQVVLRGRRL
ncbi:N-acetylglucosamine-6-phosphate deacetylase [Butyrivibrio sp. AE3006]|uniref:N-acetylglucosamine-6-phosphate deacetylase n=1 Tax=Butyrivibrio sp. AE3006 TaxID=1280673 RepID=UPI000415FBB1|nr:N-acetylglucosamine-6-phosphate deacetylase [Butyrivibrio sp. AE3006]